MSKAIEQLQRTAMQLNIDTATAAIAAILTAGKLTPQGTMEDAITLYREAYKRLQESGGIYRIDE